MRVLLVKPYNLSDHIQPSLGLGCLAQAIRDKSEVRILDCIKENVNLNRFSSVIREYRPDVVGFQCYTFDLSFIKNASRIAKDLDSSIITITGGPHPSALPNETLGYFGENMDFAFRGECERSLPILLDYLDGKSVDFSSIPGLIWRDNDAIRANECYFEEDLDNIAFPAWDLIHPENYPESQHGAFYRKFPIAPIMITRGCPYQCTFCAGKLVSGTRFRKRSIRNVLSEINLLYNDYGIREFDITDDNFTLDLNYAKSLLKELIALNLDISMATPNGVRLDALDEELLVLMKKSGFYLISLGIESGSNRILKLMKKNFTVEKIKEKVRFIRQYGFDIAGFFILGFPGETKEDILNTIKLSLELDLIRANYFTYLPFPGTESYNKLKESGELKQVDWNRFYFMNAAYTPPGMNRKQLKQMQRIAFYKFFLRPHILWKNIAAIRSLKHFKFLLKRFYHWIVIS